MLRNHRGTPPDLILRWSRITQPGDIDVVVHFHGYGHAGQKDGVRIDRNKEGRAVSTFRILHRQAARDAAGLRSGFCRAGITPAVSTRTPTRFRRSLPRARSRS
jgi:hypothetical protein